MLIKCPLSARILDIRGRVFHKVAWIAKLLGTHLSMVHKKVKFSWRDNYSPLALKGLKHFVNDGFYSDLKLFVPCVKPLNILCLFYTGWVHISFLLVNSLILVHWFFGFYYSRRIGY